MPDEIDLDGPEWVEPRFRAGYLLTSVTARARPGSVEVSGGTLWIRLPVVLLAWLVNGLRSRRAPCGEWLQRGLLGS
jgi:hypothetical protein